jgi:hypothetical protein
MNNVLPFPRRQDQPPPEDDGPEDDRQGPSPLIMLVVVAVLVAGGWLLTGKLAEMARVQNCALAGRHDCGPVEGR